MTPSKPKFDTVMAEKVADVMQKRGDVPPPGKSRFIEDALAVVGIFQAMLYGAAESLASVGWRLGECKAETSFPWLTVIVFAGCVLPKTLGRATTGKVWESLAARIGGKS